MSNDQLENNVDGRGRRLFRATTLAFNLIDWRGNQNVRSEPPVSGPGFESWGF